MKNDSDCDTNTDIVFLFLLDDSPFNRKLVCVTISIQLQEYPCAPKMTYKSLCEITDDLAGAHIWAQTEGPSSGNEETNSLCSTCV